MNLDAIKKLNIPKQPGCYRYYNKEGRVIYIGKAVNLRSRVASYWRESTAHSLAKLAMLKEVAGIDWIETETEIEALLLEANLIKKIQPKFNILLRDDKRFTYIKISTEDKWPRVFSTRNIDKAGRYFGPFTGGEAVREIIKIIRRIWPFRSCVSLPPKACLYYRIGKCPGMCEGHIEEREYAKTIRRIIMFLEGRKKDIVKEIEKEAEGLEKELKEISTSGNLLEEKSTHLSFLKYQLINIRKILDHANIISISEKYANDVVELAKILSLTKVPERIEGYDISNIFGKEAVGSMVVFSGGEANKSEYRKFKIKLSDFGGDTRMLKEVLTRRFKRYADGEKDKWPLPDLIIIDGGKQQLNATVNVLKKFKLAVLAIAVSKGEGLRSAKAPDKIFFPGEKEALRLPLASPALHLIKRVRDEAHRFAIKYHRELRSKSQFKK